MLNIDWGSLLPRIIAILIILLIMALVLLVIKNFTNIVLGKGASKEKTTMSRVISNILRTIVVVCATLAILQACGVNVSGMIAGLGIASAIVGVAFQDYIKDIISGMRIINDKFFMVGDVIEFEEQVGVVEEFTIKVTKIRLINGTVISISNRLIESCRRLSDSHPTAINVPIPYTTDPAFADKVLEEAAEEIREWSEIKDLIYFGIVGYEASSVTYRITIFTHPTDMYAASFKCYRLVFEKLLANGISIPYTTLTLQSGDLKKAPGHDA